MHHAVECQKICFSVMFLRPLIISPIRLYNNFISFELLSLSPSNSKLHSKYQRRRNITRRDDYWFLSQPCTTHKIVVRVGDRHLLCVIVDMWAICLVVISKKI
ncbi:hypothetical protein AAZX31_20G067700 [Glycine max]